MDASASVKLDNKSLLTKKKKKNRKTILINLVETYDNSGSYRFYEGLYFLK